MTALDTALTLAARGLSVIPVPRPDADHDGKKPAIPWTAFQSRCATEAEIRRWFTSDQNIGIVCGALSGVVVVDADSPAALLWIRARLPHTPWQTKTARGFHLFYRHPGVPVTNAAHLRVSDDAEIDIRGDGGYVVAPGSVHASGARYEFAGDWTRPRDALPYFWRGWVRRVRPGRPVSRPPVPSRPGGGDLLARGRAYLAQIPRPEIGAGSDVATLYAAARVVRGFGLPEDQAVDLLWEWAGGRPHWTRAWVARKVQNALRYGSEPIGGLA